MSVKLEFSRHIVEKMSNVKFHHDASSGSRVVHAEGRTDMTKLTSAFRNFVNALKTRTFYVTQYQRLNRLPDFHKIWYRSPLQNAVKQATVS